MPHFDISALTIPKFQNKLSPIADFYAAIRVLNFLDVLTDTKISPFKEVIDTKYFIFPHATKSLQGVPYVLPWLANII